MNLAKCRSASRISCCAISLALLMFAVTSAQADGNQPTTTAQPTESQVLKAIYGKDSQSDAVSFWLPYSFSIGGDSYFTGFAYNTQPKKSVSADFPAPSETVTVTEATYRKVGSGASATWSLLGVQKNGGQFGGKGDANEIDKTQTPPNYQTHSGKFVLAVPGGYSQSGAWFSSYDLFVFDPHLTGKDAAYWSYIGNVEAGEDNSDSCGPDNAGNVPCIKSHGQLTFVSTQGQDMPSVQIAWSGPSLDTKVPGHIRNLGPSDSQRYLYDNTSKTYKQTKP
jgi:hypothetical protein